MHVRVCLLFGIVDFYGIWKATTSTTEASSEIELN